MTDDIVVRLRRDLASGLSASIGDTEEAADEIERLRAALRQIADEAWHNDDGTRAHFCHPEGCESPGIARAALVGKKRS